MKKKRWFKLDNTGKLYSSIISTRVTTIFRISATLTEMVNPTVLQDSLNNLIDRFPYFRVHLKKGFFWYYFDQSDNTPLIEHEKYYPCMNLNIKKKGSFLFRVLYYRKKISVEFSHSLTDGTGAIIFLKSLLYEYFRLIGKEAEAIEGIFKYDETPDEGEYEDSFVKHYNPQIPMPRKYNRAFHFPFKLARKGTYYIITGITPIEGILKKAREYNATLTEFLCAIYFQTILEFIDIHKYKKKPIVLNVPVNLRKLYNSKTMRNFFGVAVPHIDPRLGEYTLEEILKYVHNYMQIQSDKKYISQQIARNVKSEKRIILRAFPVVVKDLGMPSIYKYWGEANYTSGLSNLGRITMPKELEEYIERFECYPPPSIGNKIKIVTLSFKDKLYIFFGKMTVNTEIEKLFFRRLRKMGLPIKIETNIQQ